MAEKIRLWLQNHSEDICKEFKKQYKFCNGRMNKKIINQIINKII